MPTRGVIIVNRVIVMVVVVSMIAEKVSAQRGDGGDLGGRELLSSRASITSESMFRTPQGAQGRRREDESCGQREAVREISAHAASSLSISMIEAHQ